MYAFCEPVWATPITLIHIRSFEGELKLGGGIDTPTLCKRLPYYGWDLSDEVTFESIKRGLGSEINPVCPQCAREWGYRNGIEQDPEPRGWMTPVRPDGTLDEASDFDPGF